MEFDRPTQKKNAVAARTAGTDKGNKGDLALEKSTLKNKFKGNVLSLRCVGRSQS